jgi:glycosyltransferase involved in cell wall biosynthesis
VSGVEILADGSATLAGLPTRRAAPMNSTLRIARVMTRLNLGGPARQALASDPLLARRGHVLRVFAGTPAPGEGDLFDEMAARGVDVVRVRGLARGISLTGDFGALRALRRELAAFRPDVVHTHASKAGALGRRATAKLPGVARVHTFHGHVLEGYFPETLSRALIAFERRMARTTDRILAVSHATADDLVRLKVVEDPERLVVVPPGIELDPLLAIGPSPAPSGELRRLIEAAPTDFVVGVVGRLAPVKQPALALDVFEMLAPRYPALHLVFVGDGSERGLVERRIGALAPGLARRAHLVGARSDMTTVLAGLDAVLLTSRTEGLPIALIEAAAAARPAVATDVGGVGEIVAHERTGFLGKSVDDLAFGLAQLLDDRRLGPAMGARARVRVATRHSASALTDRLEAIYKIVVEERRCAS